MQGSARGILRVWVLQVSAPQEAPQKEPSRGPSAGPQCVIKEESEKEIPTSGSAIN